MLYSGSIQDFDDNNETFATQPIIQLDTGGQIAGVRYSNQTMQPMKSGTNRDQ
jgi:hypothetical protein